MLKSMTGFGSASLTTDDVTLGVDVSTLNARFLDLDIHLPNPFVGMESEIRNRITKKLQRGKIRITIAYNRKAESAGMPRYNTTAFAARYAQLKKMADRVMAPYDHLFPLALRAAEAQQEEKEDLTDTAVWKELEKHILEAVAQCDQSRIREGLILQETLYTCCKAIKDCLSEVELQAPNRIPQMRERLKTRIADCLERTEFDKNRMEQEMLFYTERMAIDEELVRLQAHLSLFEDALDAPVSSGKKLNFVAQEIGREINTIGAKANDVAIQRIVIAMKEELEKIKEQLHNVV